jgi:hypothetical protein
MKLYYILLFIFISVKSFAQNIYSAIHLNDKYEINYQKPIKKIKLKSTFYNSKDTERQSETITLNNFYRVVSSERFNENDELIFKYENEFRNDSLIVKTTTTRKIPLLGYEYTYSEFEYDSKNFLTKKTKFNNQNKVLETVTYENNDNGNPILLKINNGEFGYEKAIYDYVNNSYTSLVYNSKDELISTDQNIWLNYNKKFKEQKINEFGDTIEDNYFLFKYKYDKFGNWTKQIRYKKIGKNKILNAEFSKKIIYN